MSMRRVRMPQKTSATGKIAVAMAAIVRMAGSGACSALNVRKTSMKR